MDLEISAHDPLCPWEHRLCECPLIERVKDREGERYGWATADEAVVQREERERLLEQVKAIEGYSTFSPDGSLDGADAVLRSDVLDLLKEKSE